MSEHPTADLEDIYDVLLQIRDLIKKPEKPDSPAKSSYRSFRDCAIDEMMAMDEDLCPDPDPFRACLLRDDLIGCDECVRLFRLNCDRKNKGKLRLLIERLWKKMRGE